MKKLLFFIFFLCLFCQESLASENDNVLLKTMTDRLVQINNEIGIKEVSYELFLKKIKSLSLPIENKTATSFDFKQYTYFIIQNPLNALKSKQGRFLPYYKLLQTKQMDELALIFGYDAIFLHKHDQAIIYLNYFLKKSKNMRLKQQVWLQTAQSYYRLGKYTDSLMVLETLINEHPLDMKKSSSEFLERIYQMKALNFRQQGRTLLAEQTYMAIVELVEQQKNPVHLAEVKNQMALFYLETGDFAKALDCSIFSCNLLSEMIDKAEKIFFKDKDALEAVYTYSIGLQYLGLIYLQLNQTEEAISYIEKSLEYFELMAARKDLKFKTLVLAKIKYSQCYGYNLLGHLYVREKNYAAAENALHAALEIAEKTNYLRGKIDALTGFGEAAHVKGNIDEALKYFQNALILMDESGHTVDFRVKIPVLIGLGKSLKMTSDFQTAGKFYDQAISLGIENQINFFSWEAYRGKAQICIAMEDDRNAYENFDNAIRIIENTRLSISDEMIRYAYMEDKFSTYDEFIRFLINLEKKNPGKGYKKKAFEIFEKKQARIFLEKIGKSVLERCPEEIEGLIFQRENLENELYFLIRKLSGHQVLSAQFKKEDKIQDLRLRIDQAKIALDEINRKIEAAYPEFYQLRYPQPLQSDELQQQLLKPDELVLVYHVAADTVILWMIDQNNFLCFDLLLTPSDLKKGIDRLYGDLKYESVFDFDVSCRRFAGNSYALSSKLIPEAVRKRFSGKKHLYIVPTGDLYRLPFGTLVTANGKAGPRYLINDIPIAYLSSTALLKIISNQKKQNFSKATLLAFGNPDYSGHGHSDPVSMGTQAKKLKNDLYLNISRAGEKNKRFTALPKTRDEILGIAKVLGIDENSDTLNLGLKASEGHVLQLNRTGELKRYHYLVFACHGILPGEIDDVKEPAIILSQPDPVGDYDGFLTMHEVFELKLNAELTLLSACSTGSGTFQVGEGIRGMTRAFMYAGSGAVAVNLWQVDSTAAGLNSIDLFKYISDGRERSNALRMAKLDMIQKRHGKKYIHPFFWGSMILFGDGRNLRR